MGKIFTIGKQFLAGNGVYCGYCYEEKKGKARMFLIEESNGEYGGPCCHECLIETVTQRPED